MSFRGKMPRMTAVICITVFVLSGCAAEGGAAHSGDQGSPVDQVLTQRAAETDRAQQSGDEEDLSGTEDNKDEVDPEILDLVRDIADENGIQDPLLTGEDSSGSDATDWKQIGPADPEEGFPMAQMPADCDVDVDLTILNSTMVYSEVYNMVMYPDKYVGKSVRMRGFYSPYLDETTNKIYHACFITDAAACCQQGIEFDPKDAVAMKYPEDYPQADDDITVVGVYDIYEEDGITYCTLRDAVIEENRGLSL